MCNCSNFEGDGTNYENIGSDNRLYSYVDNEDISFENYDGDDEDMDLDEDMSNYSDMHEQDEDDTNLGRGGVRAYSRADGDFDEDDYTESDDGEFEDYDGDDEDEMDDEAMQYFTDDEFGGNNDVFNFDGDEQYDEFLTKRSRARRKLRKSLKKKGVSRKDRRKQALASIPKQKLGKLIGFAIRGKSDPETTSIIKGLEKKGVISTKKDGLEKVAEQVSQGLEENVNEGTQNLGTDIPVDSPTNTMPANDTTNAGAGGGKKKVMIMVAIGLVVVVGGYFAYKKFS